jgi:hypothetical protein
MISTRSTKRKNEEHRPMSPLDDILKRLESIERRLARLEAAASPTTPAPREAANEPSPKTPPPAAVQTPAPSPPRPSVILPPLRPGPATTPLPVVDPVTERLTPVPPKPPAAPPAAQPGDAPFPDLSMIDEKVEPRKGPAERVNVRSALEDYPRICTRIQQLWGAPECEAYINDLVIDTRGNRKGFPPAMMEELLYLGRLARVLVIMKVDGDIWETLDQVGDRR